MSTFNFQPEKYWNVYDERIPILKKYLDSLKIEQLELLPTEEIIEMCINGLKTFELTDEEKITLKNIIINQNGKVWMPSIREICKELLEMNTKEVTLISLGCGDDGSFEKMLDEEIAKDLSTVKVNWVGLDVGDFRSCNSFFNQHPFKIIKEDTGVRYLSFADDEHTPALLIGIYSFHHIGINYDEFLKRCEGLAKVVLIEEPTTNELWNIPGYRFMRIAYDVLANTVFVISWAETFIKNQNLFKVNYIKIDTLPNSTKLLEFKDVLPETVLLVN